MAKLIKFTKVIRKTFTISDDDKSKKKVELYKSKGWKPSFYKTYKKNK